MNHSLSVSRLVYGNSLRFWKFSRKTKNLEACARRRGKKTRKKTARSDLRIIGYKAAYRRQECGAWEFPVPGKVVAFGIQYLDTGYGSKTVPDTGARASTRKHARSREVRTPACTYSSYIRMHGYTYTHKPID